MMINEYAIALIAPMILALTGCAAEESIKDTGEGIDFNACCLTSDPYNCALGKLDPGEKIDLVCGIHIYFPKVVRWELANELAEISCNDQGPWWCAPELARKMCPSKLDRNCQGLIVDGVTLEECLLLASPGEPVPKACQPLFPDWSL